MTSSDERPSSDNHKWRADEYEAGLHAAQPYTQALPTKIAGLNSMLDASFGLSCLA